MTDTYTPGRHTVVPDQHGGFALQAYDGDLIAYGLTEPDALLFAQASRMVGVLRSLASDDLAPAQRHEMVDAVLKAAGL